LPATVIKGDSQGMYKEGAEFQIISFKSTALARYWPPGMLFLLISREGERRNVMILSCFRAMDIDTGECMVENKTLRFEYIQEEENDQDQD